MTVTSPTNTATFDGNGVTTVFPFAFRFFADNNLEVVRTLADESTAILTLGIDYTVQGANDLDGGSITTIGFVLAADEELTVTRVLAPVQLTDLRNQGKFFAETHESVFDYLTMLIQQLGNSIGVNNSKSLRVPENIPVMAARSARAGSVQGWDENGDPIAVYPQSGSALDLAMALANSSNPALGAAMIGRSAQIVESVADLREIGKTSSSAFARTCGYFMPGDGGDGFFWLDHEDTTSVDNGGTIIVANDGGRWKLLTLATPKRFGARADSDLSGGGTDDTAAINAFIASYGNGRKHLEFDPGAAYNVTSLTLSGIDYSIDFKDCTFFGRATVATDALLTLQNFSAHNIANFHLRTDGNAASPIYHGNYQCALRMITTSPGNPATQFIRMNSLKIWYFRQGIVNGNHFGSSAQPSFTQSEIWIDDYQVRGVNRPYVGNLVNSYVVFTNSGFIPQKFEASSAWWVDGDGFCAANLDSRSMVTFQNCEFQRAIIAGYALYGNEMYVIEPIWEVSCQTYVAGNITIVGGIDGYFGVASVIPFAVTASATGKLHLERFNLHRPAGTADFDRSLLVDCTGNVNFRVWLTNCRLGEWDFNAALGSGDLVRDGRLKIVNTWIDNSTGTAPSYELNPDQQIIQNVDRIGDTMVTSSTTTTGGWTVYTGAANGAFGSNVTAPPLNFAKMILMNTNAGGTFGIATPTANGARIPVQANRDYLFETWIRVGGSVPAGSTISFAIDWYDFAGTLGNTSTLFSLDSATFGPFTANRRVRSGVTPPPNASSAVIRVAIGPNLTVRFCDISLT